MKKYQELEVKYGDEVRKCFDAVEKASKIEKKNVAEEGKNIRMDNTVRYLEFKNQ